MAIGIYYIFLAYFDHFTPSSDVSQNAGLWPLMFALLINLNASVLQNSKLLIFSNDIKIFSTSTISNCQVLQNDLQYLNLTRESY